MRHASVGVLVGAVLCVPRTWGVLIPSPLCTPARHSAVHVALAGASIFILGVRHCAVWLHSILGVGQCVLCVLCCVACVNQCVCVRVCSQVAKYCLRFGMRVIGFDPIMKPAVAEKLGVELVRCPPLAHGCAHPFPRPSLAWRGR